MRAIGALMADALAVVVFVAVGLIQHGIELTVTTVTLVGWPFFVGLLLGHLAIRAWRRPFAIWPHGVFVWVITVVGAMTIRTAFGAQPPLAFVLVTAGVLGVVMLGWRAIALWVTRHERRQVINESDLASTIESDRSAASGSDPLSTSESDLAAASGSDLPVAITDGSTSKAGDA